MKRISVKCLLVLFFCFILGTITVNAADERLGTVVDGSLACRRRWRQKALLRQGVQGGHISGLASGQAD